MHEIKISIVIPVYNVEKYLRQCLDSLVNQTLRDIEIICVNDGSTDSSLEILNSYAQSDNRIVVINIENGGVSNARNVGLKNVSGEYVTFVDSDDWLDLEFCEKLYDIAQKEQADAVMCGYMREYENRAIATSSLDSDYIVWTGDEFKDKFHRRLFGLTGEELSSPEKGDGIVSTWAQIFKKELAQSAEFYDIKKLGTFEDGLYQIDVYKNCNRFVYVNEPLYHYRKTNTQSITTKYRENLFTLWQNLYGILGSRIEENGYPQIYQEALNNRICLGLIGLGLNELSDKESGSIKKAKRLKSFLRTERYRKAFKNLNLKPMPLKWKGFFLLCKWRMTFCLVVLLKIIDFLRRRVS